MDNQILIKSGDSYIKNWAISNGLAMRVNGLKTLHFNQGLHATGQTYDGRLQSDLR